MARLIAEPATALVIAALASYELPAQKLWKLREIRLNHVVGNHKQRCGTISPSTFAFPAAQLLETPAAEIKKLAANPA